VIDDLDDTIRELRLVIFELQPTGHGDGLRSRMLAVLDDERAALGFGPHVRFDGLVDTVGDATAVLATLREALSNVARHAGASQVDIEVSAGDDLVLLVRDDGRGFDATSVRSGYGVRNMGERAHALGGHVDVGPAPGGGTIVEWKVPAKRSHE
jgi:signal transduction histidine kinase